MSRFNSNPQPVPANQATNWYQKVMTALIGTTPGQQQVRHGADVSQPVLDPKLSHDARRGPRPRTVLVYDALAEAGADFDYNEVRPLRELVPGTRFVLEQIRTLCTPDGLALMGDVISLRRAHRNKAVISKIGHLGFDLSQFCDWRIEAQSDANALDAAAAEGEVLTVIAGDGPYRVKLNFQFFGRFDEVELCEPDSVPKPAPTDMPTAKTPPRPAAAASLVPDPVEKVQAAASAPRTNTAASTLVSEPVSPGQRAATLIDDAGTAPITRPPLARLRLRLHDGQEQLIDLTELPFDIGREPELKPACTVPESAARVSRQHVRLEKLQAGAVLVHNLAHQRSGTWCNGDKLDQRFAITPVPAASTGGWHILGERNLGAHSVAMRIEQAV